MAWGSIDEFTGFLVAGLLIIAVLIAAFSITPYAVAKAPFPRAPEIMVVNVTKGIFVGQTQEDSFASFGFHVDASNHRTLQTVPLGDAEISNGLLFSEKDFSYKLPADAEDAKIRFRVSSTNGLEALAVLVDGNKVGEARTAGDYEFALPTGSLVELRAVSSAWQMWAPNIYMLENIEIGYRIFTEKSDIFRFSLSDEQAEGFVAGKIDLVMTENTGSLVLLLNGVKVFEGPVNDLHTVRFDSRGIKDGENVLLILADRNAKMNGIASMQVFYKKTVVKEAVTHFSLTDEEWTRLQTGEIRFVVSKVLEEGGVAVRITHNKTLLFSDFMRLEEGRHYSVGFDQRHVRAGANQLIIQAINGGRFEVADIEIRI